MKKISAVLLVALLACSMTFAAFTGSAETTFGYDFKTGEYGFANSTAVKLDGEILLGGNGGKTGEGKVYGEIKGSFEFKVPTIDKVTDQKGMPVTVDAKVQIDSAKIIGENWSLDILNAQGAADYAKSVIDTWKDGNKTKNATFAPGITKTTGVTLEIEDWKASLGLTGDKDLDNALFSATVETPEFDLEGVKLQAASAVSYGQKADKFEVAASAKASYAADKLSVSGAADFGFGTEFNMDVAANVTYDFVVTDIYYGMKPTNEYAVENLLSLKNVVTTDPVVVTTTLKDMVNRQDMLVAADIKVVDGLTLGAKAGYRVDNKTLTAGANAAYAVKAVENLVVTPSVDDTLTVVFADPDAVVTNDLKVKATAEYTYDVFKFGAGLQFGLKTVSKVDPAMTLGAYANVTTTAIDGAEIALTLGNAKLENDLLHDNYGVAQISCKLEF